MLKIFLSFLVSAGIVFSFVTPAFANTTNILHSFSGVPTDGDIPQDSLTLSGSKLYGMTQRGGATNEGIIFSMNNAGSTYEILHEFTAASDDGGMPNGSLILSSGKLYGMTRSGGSDGLGVIFSIEGDGSNFEVLHSFTGELDDGSSPLGSLISEGAKLYGMTAGGGSDDLGTVFSMDSDGSNFEVLHSFTGELDDGSAPQASLTKVASKLYGMTSAGGENDRGTIFSIEGDGSNFEVLHSFGGSGDGEVPDGSLHYSDAKLYGVTPIGGGSDEGVIFSIDVSGSGYRMLREFTAGTSDGGNPHQGVVSEGNKLYGMTNNGGASSNGTIFSMDKDGSNFSLVYSFAGSPGDGSHPLGLLTLTESTLYGLTSDGGVGGDGVVFSLSRTSSSSGSSTSLGQNSCSGKFLQQSPNLFQIDTTQNTATLFFVPVGGATNYLISYGVGESTSQYSVFTNQGQSSGVLVYTINSLNSNSPYAFNVTAQNGCVLGNAGNTMNVYTKKAAAKFYRN